MGYWPFSKNKKYGADSNPYAAGSIANAQTLDQYGNPAQIQGLQNLFQMLQTQGRVDPRLLASAQAANSRSTNQQQQQARGGFAASGLGNSGLSAAIQAAIASAGANRSANLNYQDLSDSYARNQQNLGLMGQLVTQPQQGYAGISADLYNNFLNAEQRGKAARVSALGQGISAGAGAGTGGCWVAEAIFGKDSATTHLARFYVNSMASDELKDAYLEHGTALASIVETDGELKAALAPVFLSFAQTSILELYGA